MSLCKFSESREPNRLKSYRDLKRNTERRTNIIKLVIDRNLKIFKIRGKCLIKKKKLQNTNLARWG